MSLAISNKTCQGDMLNALSFPLDFQPDLAAHEAKLMQKIQLLCVMEVRCMYFQVLVEVHK